MSKFVISDETGKEREAFLITNISYNSDNYSIYAINRDNENVNIFVSKLIRNIDDTVMLVDIYNSEKKTLIDNIVKEVIMTNNLLSLKDKKIDIIESYDYSNSRDLSFTSYKTYVFSIKKDLYVAVLSFYNVELGQQNNNINSNNNGNNDYIELIDEKPKFMNDIPQKVNEKDNTLYEIDNKKASKIEEAFKKITIEKLNIDDDDALKGMFDEDKVVTSNSNGYVSDILLILIGLSAFVITVIFLILQLKIAS